MKSPAEVYREAKAIAFTKEAAHAAELNLPEEFLGDHEIIVEACVTDAGDRLIVLNSDKEGVRKLAEIFGGKAIQIGVRLGREFKFVDMVTARFDLQAHELDIADTTYHTKIERKSSEALMKMN
jgi:hypothetical protein